MEELGKKGNKENESSSSSSSSNSNKDENENENENVTEIEALLKVLETDEWFAKLKDEEDVLHGFLRDTVRNTYQLSASNFASLPSFLAKNLIFIQLVVLDTDGSIQGKLYMTGSKEEPTASNLVQRSRKLLKDVVPYLLKDTKEWFFSRSLVFKVYNGAIDEAVEFSKYDPVGDLLDPPMKPSGIRCAEVFLFVSGEFELREDGLFSREAVKELLHELNSEEGISKLLGFDCVAACVMVPKMKLEELKDIHLSLTA